MRTALPWLGSPSVGLEIGVGAVDAIGGWRVEAVGTVDPCVEDPGLTGGNCQSGVPVLLIHCTSTLGGAMIMPYEVKR